MDESWIFLRNFGQKGLEEYDELKEIGWEWQSLAGRMLKGTISSRGDGSVTQLIVEKMRMKRSLITGENGLPLAVVLDGANRHDVKHAV